LRLEKDAPEPDIGAGRGDASVKDLLEFLVLVGVVAV